MKFSEYFHQQSQIHMDSRMKMKIYDKFLRKKHYHSSLFSRTKFYFKVVLSTSLVVGLFVAVYPQVVDQKVGDGYLVSNVTDIQHVVMANEIGRVIDFQGEFAIMTNGVKVQTDMIKDGDRVMLYKNSFMQFQVKSGVLAKISGPAEFSISAVEEGKNKQYVINLLQGEYFEIKTPKTRTTIEEVIVKTTTMLITTTSPKSDMNFQIMTVGNKKIVKNNGDDISITSGKKKIISVKKQQSAELGDDEAKIIKQVEKITKELKEKNISSTYEVDTVLSGVIAVSSGSTGDSLEVVGKNLPDTDQMNKLSASLNPHFVMQDIYNIASYYLKGQKDPLAISLSNASYRLKSLTRLFDLPLSNPSTVTIGSLIDQTDMVIAGIDQGRYISPRHIVVLKTFKQWMVLLSQYSFAEATDKELIDIDSIITYLGVEEQRESLIIK